MYLCQYEFPFSANVISAECIMTVDMAGEDVAGVETWLFVAQPDENYAIWDGAPYTLEELRQRYDVDHVEWLDDMNDVVASLGRSNVLTIQHPTDAGRRTDITLSAAAQAFETMTVDYDIFYTAVTTARTLKSEDEIDMVRWASRVSAAGHKVVMQRGGQDFYDFEYQISAEFRRQTGFCSQERQAYLPIAPAGKRTSILHYNENREPVSGANNDMVLIDAGSEGHGYGTDITRTWPTSGRYTEEQKAVYETVLYAQDTALHALELGQTWAEVTRVSRVALTDGLIEAGLLTCPLQRCIDLSMDRAFMPHSLGHNIGIDVHDGGFLSPISAGHVFTVEPGVYMIEAVLANHYADEEKAPYLNRDLIEQFRSEGNSLGGVRIEDVVAMHSDGSWELLSGEAPRTVEDIENFIRTGEYTFDPKVARENARLAYERMERAVEAGSFKWPVHRTVETFLHH